MSDEQQQIIQRSGMRNGGIQPSSQYRPNCQRIDHSMIASAENPSFEQ